MKIWNNPGKNLTNPAIILEKIWENNNAGEKLNEKPWTKICH